MCKGAEILAMPERSPNPPVSTLEAANNTSKAFPMAQFTLACLWVYATDECSAVQRTVCQFD